MTLDELLRRFESPREAAKASNSQRTAAYHWYASGNKRMIPPPRVIVAWIQHLGLSDAVLGSVIRDCVRLKSRKKIRQRKRKASKVPVDWKAKEEYLAQTAEKQQEESHFLDRITDILEEHIK